MKYPWWKSALSYLVDLPVRSWKSEKNGEMDVALSRGQLKLSTQNAVYSFGLNYRSFAYAFDMLNIHNDQSIKKVLVLGWGIGSIADLLNKHSSVRKITGIEHDESLIEYFNAVQPEYSFEINLLHGDAVEFVNACDDQYDLICSDIFFDNITPNVIISAAYIQGLSHLIAPGGKVLLSKLNTSMKDKKQNQLLESNLQAAGLNYHVVNTIGNRMYHWSME